ncbi:caspase family protein [Spirosoma harenae]
MKASLLLLCCLCLAVLGWAYAPPTKRALIIAIGNYPQKTGWSTISSSNDIELIKKALERQGFGDKNVAVLKDSNANHDNIVKALKELIDAAQKGDKIVIHFSSHGQQITDDNNDESDRYDEAIVCFGAPESSHHPFESYKGEQHLRDDELGKLLDELRQKLGSSGDVLLLVDACHSGTITRGSTARLRGSSRPMRLKGYHPRAKKPANHAFLYQKPVSQTGVAPYVAISAANAHEANSECWVGRTPYGSLSYAFNQALIHAQPGESYRAMFARIQSVMKARVPGQTPQIEGDVDRRLFGGDVVEQAKYLTVSNVSDNGSRLRINSGQLNGLFDSSRVVICPGGTQSPLASNILATGIVLKSTPASAEVVLNRPLPGSNSANYWVFVTEYASADLTVNIQLDSLRNPTQRTQVQTELKKNKLVRFIAGTDSTGRGDLYIKALNGGSQVQFFRNDGTPLDAPIPITQLTQLSQQMQRYAQSQYLQQLNLRGNANVQFSARLIPLRPGGKMPEDTLADASRFYVGSTLSFVGNEQENSAFLFTNTGSVTLYYTVLDIMPNGKVEVLLPCQNGPNCQSDQPSNYRVNPGESKLAGRTIAFSPPYGKETFKVFVTTEPVDLRDVVGNNRGASATRGSMQRLKRLYDDTNDMGKLGVGTRGGVSQSIPDEANIATQNIEFEILKERSTNLQKH